MSKETMKLALEALENWVEYFPQNVDDIDKKAITSLREELSKPDFWEGYVPEPVKPAQQELVACRYGDNGYACCEGGPCAAEEHNNKTEWQDRGMVAEAALAKLLGEKQEPVAVVSGYYGGQCVILPIDPARIFNSNTALYTSPPAQRTWVGLSDEEIQTTWDSVMDGAVFTRREVYKAIEAKLKEKNNG